MRLPANPFENIPAELKGSPEREDKAQTTYIRCYSTLSDLSSGQGILRSAIKMCETRFDTKSSAALHCHFKGGIYGNTHRRYRHYY